MEERTQQRISQMKSIFMLFIKINICIIFCLIINFIYLPININAIKNESNIFYDHSIVDTSMFYKEELEQEKTKNSKTYKYENGLMETSIYNKAVHFVENGKYVNIDNTLKEYGDIYQNNKNSYKITFPKNIKNNKIMIKYGH